jgi:hypothetical protein
MRRLDIRFRCLGVSADGRLTGSHFTDVSVSCASSAGDVYSGGDHPSFAVEVVDHIAHPKTYGISLRVFHHLAAHPPFSD